jgi:hypothetical protein
VNERIAVGARIGFGTTDPTAVTAWYEILSITNDTTLTITGTVNLAGSTPYVIEEIRIALALDNAVARINGGGLLLVKGLHYGVFQIGGVVGVNIPAAGEASIPSVQRDNVRAVYCLRDQIGTTGLAFTSVTRGSPNILSIPNHGMNVSDPIIFRTSGTLPGGLTADTYYYVTDTNYGANQFSVSATLRGPILAITSAGTGVHTAYAASGVQPCAIDVVGIGQSATNHDLYLISGATLPNTNISRFNLRAPLIITPIPGIANTGFCTGGLVYKTALINLSASVAQINAGKIFTTRHGAGAGQTSFYYGASSRVYRSSLSSITNGSVDWVSDFIVDIPPGTPTTFTAQNVMQTVDYSNKLDRLLIGNNLAARPGIFFGQYLSLTTPFEKYAGSNINRVKTTNTPSGAIDGLFPPGSTSIWVENGYMFITPLSGTSWVWVLPVDADAFYNSISNEQVVTPKLATPNAYKLYHVYVDHMDYAGDYGIGSLVESYRIWCRTTGIDDNSGDWIEITNKSNLENITPGDYIQFKIAFELLGEFCVPTRIYSLCVTYEDNSQDSHYSQSLSKSSAANKIFAWEQVVAWNKNIPDLRVQLFDVSSNAVLLNDTVAFSSFGNWGYSTNGVTWSAWDSTKDAVGNYIRYTATTFSADQVSVRPILTQV